jgi:hypothetical protein
MTENKVDESLYLNDKFYHIVNSIVFFFIVIQYNVFIIILGRVDFFS